MKIRRIGIMTGGGDCPGLNAAIRAITKTAITDYNWEVVGIQDGFEGLIEGKSRELTFNDVSNILPLGGTILGTSNKFDFDAVVEAINRRSKKGKRFSIIVAAEGARPVKEGYTVKQYVKDSPDPVRLGGIGERVAEYISKKTSHEARVTVLGHLQRGGTPTFFDRILATRYGVAAVRLGEKGMFGKMVALRGTEIAAVDLEEAASGLRLVTPDHPLVVAAKSLGTSFGVSS